MPAPILTAPIVRAPILLGAVCALALLFALPGAALAAEEVPASGGLVAGTTFVSAPAGAFAGKQGEVRGFSPLNGAIVVQVSVAGGEWTSIGPVTAKPGEPFELMWKPARSGRYELRAVPATAGAADASAQDAAAAGLGQLTVYRLQRTTWYGPGNYSARTACGQRLTRRTLGVAHRTLPCGTRVEFFKAGKSVTVPVIDRGPFVRGVTWDLTYAAAKRVNMLGSERIGAYVIR